MTQQLELFPDLPLGLRQPRRARLLGFSLDCLSNLWAENAEHGQQTNRNEMEMAVIVAEAKLFGHVIPKAYGCVVRIEETREQIAKNSRLIDKTYSDIERELARIIERQLKRAQGGSSNV